MALKNSHYRIIFYFDQLSFCFFFRIVGDLYNTDKKFQELVGSPEDASGPSCLTGNPLQQKMLKRCWEYLKPKELEKLLDFSSKKYEFENFLNDNNVKNSEHLTKFKHLIEVRTAPVPSQHFRVP